MRRKGEKILAILLILQFVMFMGLGTYVQNTYAEEPVNNQIEKTEQYQDEDSNDLEDVQEEKKTEEAQGKKKTDNLGQKEEATVEEDDTVEGQQPEENVSAEVAEQNSEVTEQSPELNYQAHVSNIGWQTEVKEGEIAGTTGKSLAVEALRLNMVLPEGTEGGIEYAAHVSNIGWQKSVQNGEIAGTTGKSKSIEAIKINLTGDIAEKYDVYYRVHSANFGWLGWAKNGEYAGSAGYARAVEALEIRLYKKDAEDKPLQEQKSYKSETNEGRVSYQAHMQDVGWMSKVTDGNSAGIPNGNKELQALKINVADDLRGYGQISGSVVYQAHVENVGWQKEVKDGQLAGTVGKNKHIEALRIKLTDQLAEKYDI